MKQLGILLIVMFASLGAFATTAKANNNANTAKELSGPNTPQDAKVQPESKKQVLLFDFSLISSTNKASDSTNCNCNILKRNYTLPGLHKKSRMLYEFD